MRSVLRNIVILAVLLSVYLHSTAQQTSTGLEDKLLLTIGRVTEEGFLICNEEGTNFTANANNNTTYKGFQDGTYEINQGDGKVFSGLFLNKDFPYPVVYTKPGTYTLEFSVLTTAGVKVTRTYTVKALGRPKINLKKTTEATQCIGNEIEYLIDVYHQNTEGTKYTLDFDDGTEVRYLRNRDLANSKGLVRHVFDHSYCDELHEGSSHEAFVITLTAINECNFSPEKTTLNEHVAEPIRAGFTFDNPTDIACTFQKLRLVNTTTGGRGSDCTTGEIRYTWDLGNGEIYRNPNPEISYEEAKEKGYVIRLIASNNFSCATDTAYESVVVVDRVVADFEIRTDSLCSGETLRFVNKSTGGGSMFYQWKIVPLDGRPMPRIINGNYNTVHPQILFDHWGKYKIELTVSNGCSFDTKETIVVVGQDPEIRRFDIPSSICPSRLDLSDWVSIDWNGNGQKPRWTIALEGAEPNTGFTTLPDAGLTSTYPVIDFHVPGVYTLTLELPGGKCGGDKLKESKRMIVYDPDILTDIETSDLDICEGGVVSFENHSKGKGLRYEWKVFPASSVEFANGSRYTDASPMLQFNKYGDYQVSLKILAEGGCGRVDTTFQVHVRKEPALFYFDLPSAVCPDEVIDFREKIIYRFYNNEEKARWTITPLSGLEFLDGTDVNSLYPKIRFVSPSTDYTFTVKLENQGCDMKGVSQEETRKLYVRASAMTMSAFATDTLICEGEKIDFSMRSSSEESDLLLYNWSVTPTDGSYDFSVVGNQAAVSSIVFNHWGIYQVKGETRGFCGTLDTTITVRIKKDPEVTLRDTSGICPGVMDMSDYVGYRWNGNKQQVVWKVIPATNDTPGDGFEFVEGNETSLYPKIHFKSGGLYELRVKLNGVDCGGEKLEAIRQYQVYDTTLVVDMGPDRMDICEGEKVRFRNMNQGVGLTYRWDISGPEGGYVFQEGTDERSAAPVLLFTRYGEYDLTVNIDGICNAKQRSYHITVRGIPEILLDSRIPKICAGAETVDLKNYLVYVDRKNCDVVPRWTISPSSGYTYVEGYGADSDFPRILFGESGNYTVTLETTPQCGGTLTYTTKIDVIKNEIVPVFDLPEEGCVPLQVHLENKSEGDSLSYTWSVAARTSSGGGWSFAEPDDEHDIGPRLDLQEQGNYDISLAVTNICGTKTMTKSIRAYAVPTLHVGDITGVCESFELAMSDTVKVEENNDPLRKALWTITPEARFKEGYSRESLFPELTFDHGTYHIRAELWNGCPEPGIGEFDVVVDEFIPVPPIPNDTLCHLEPALALTALPQGGIWQLAGAEDLLKEKSGKMVFDPLRAGEYELVYRFTNGSCVATNTKKIKVHALPVVEAGENTGMCLNHDPRILKGLPEGGWWEGPGIASPVFTPQRPGDVRLMYYYKDEHQCVNRDSMIMSVYALPDTSFLARDQYCRGKEAEFAVSSREKEYIWNYGDGTSKDTTEGNGKHIYPLHGFYDVQLVAVSEHLCMDTSAFRKIEVVNDAPKAAFTLDKHVECGPEVNVDITLDEEAYADPNLHFHWDFGNGNFSDQLRPSLPQLYTAGTWDTTYAIAFKVYNICNSTDSVDHLLVKSLPVAGLEFQHKWNCSPLTLQVKNTSTGDDNRYTWYMGDGSVEDDVYQPREHLYVSDEGTKVFDVSLVARNTCGEDSISKPLTVLAQTLQAFFDTPKTDLCVGEEICFTNHTTDSVLYVKYKYWDFGDETRDTTWNACHRYQAPGDYKVLLYVDNGCGFDTISDRLQVKALPQLKLESEEAVCDRDTFHFDFQSDQKLQWWQWSVGDKVLSLERQPEHVFAAPGEYQVRLEVISDNIALCKASAEKTVTVHPRPVLSFAPRDTLVCPPWLYVPQVNGEAFTLMWDYGDGSEVTSSAEHWYENETDSVLHHRVVLHAVSDKGCPEDFAGNIAVANLPVAEIRKEVIQGRPQQVTLLNLSRDYTDCVWYLPPDRVEHTFDNRYLEFRENGTHRFSLVAYNQYGCKDSVSLEHEVLLKGLYFPNTFIPHSQQEKVSRFNGIGMGLIRYKLEIFDQYYNKIWETRALRDGKPSEGWDGCNVKGERMPQGVYIWRAEAIFKDADVWNGKNNGSGIPQTMQGTVLLLRE